MLAWVSCSAEQLLMRSGNVDVLRAVTKHGLYLSDTWELNIRDCISCSLLRFSGFLTCLQYH